MPSELCPAYARRAVVLPDDPRRIAEITASVRALAIEDQICVGQEFTALASDDPPDESLALHLRSSLAGHGAGYEFYCHPIGGGRRAMVLSVAVAVSDRAAAVMFHGIFATGRAPAGCRQFGAPDRSVTHPVWDQIKETRP
jgi:hypothetical protein